MGQAAIVISLLPVITLLWVFFSFVYCVLFWGVWDDFFDLESSLCAVRGRLRTHFAKTVLMVLVTALVNGPILFSLVLFVVQLKQNTTDWLWRLQFSLSFVSNLALALLYFTGGLLGQDHSILQKSRSGEEDEPFAGPPPPSRTGCFPWCRQAFSCLADALVHSEASHAVRIYMRSTIQGGGALSSGVSPWGQYAAASFLPQAVDLDGTATPAEEEYGDAQGNEEGKGGDDEEEEEDDERWRHSYQQRRHTLTGQNVKAWPTPWNAGWYLVQWWGRRRGDGRRLDHTPCFRLLVTLPWTLLLVATLGLLAYTAFMVQAYVLFAFILSYFLCVPLLHAVLARLISLYCRPAGLLVLDSVLTVLLAAGFLLSLSGRWLAWVNE